MFLSFWMEIHRNRRKQGFPEEANLLRIGECRWSFPLVRIRLQFGAQICLQDESPHNGRIRGNGKTFDRHPKVHPRNPTRSYPHRSNSGPLGQVLALQVSANESVALGLPKVGYGSKPRPLRRQSKKPERRRQREPGRVKSRFWNDYARAEETSFRRSSGAVTPTRASNSAPSFSTTSMGMDSTRKAMALRGHWSTSTW